MADFMLGLIILALIVLCVGDPDLLDAIVKYVMSLSGGCK